MQQPHPTPAEKTPVFQAQLRDERQPEVREEKRSVPVPLDDEQIESIGGGYRSPNTTW